MVTNTMSLSSVRLEEHLDSILGFGTTPKELLPGIIHEATHHWCFLSPVGFVLSHLQIRARTNSVLLHSGQGDITTLRQLVGNVVRYETTLSLLRPFAEGLALFAEFDMISSKKSSVVSVPTELTGWLFSDGLEGIQYGSLPIYLPYDGMQNPLLDWRQSNQCLKRKVALFGHSFDVNDGGYLSGYLAVRQLWFQIASQDRRLLNESDLFLMFARSFFYDDYELIALLLDESPVELSTSEAIFSHIAERFAQLGQISVDRIKQFEEGISAHKLGSEEEYWLEAIVSDQEAARRGHEMAQELLGAIGEHSLDSIDGSLLSLETKILEQRDIITFGQLDVQVDVFENGQYHVIYKDKVIHSGSCLLGVKPGSGIGSINLLCSILSEAKIRATVVHRGDELVAISFSGPDERKEQVRQRFINFSRNIQASTDEMKECLDSVLAWEGVAEVIEEMRSILPEFSEAVYAANAFPNICEEKRSSLVTAIREDGLLPILNWDRKLLTGIALLSLSWSQRLRRPQIIEFLKEHGIDLETTLKKVEACSNEYGVPEIWEQDDIFLCSV